MTIVDPACSRVWDAAALPAWGTAARADLVVALEQNGPWGRVAATGSHLDPSLGAALDAHVTGLGGRLLLIRRPGRHAEPARHRAATQVGDPDADADAEDRSRIATQDPADGTPATRRCYVARTGPGGWLVRADLADPGSVLRLSSGDLDSAEAVAGLVDGLIDTAPLLLVCTNGRRDLCCAQRGRVITGAFTAAPEEQVWETSHIGGHRFSPTAVLLPWGRMLARLDPHLAASALDAAATGTLAPALLGPEHDRGPMHLPALDQAADAWLRLQEHRVDLEDPLTGLRERVEVAVDHGPALPESCGKSPVPTVIYRPGWRA